MFQTLAGRKTSEYIQLGINVLSVLLFVAWFVVVGFVLLQGAYEIAGVLILFTLLISGLAYVNE